MAWVDSMRLRRRADKMRAIGWVNLFVAIPWAFIHASDSFDVLAASGVWAAGVMGVVYAIAWMIDRRAERVIGR